MKRPLVTTFLAVLAAVALAGGGLYYLAGSVAGTQWLSQKISALSDGALEWDQVEGTFLRSLGIHGLRLRLPGMALDIEKATLEWSPARLLSRTVQVDHVAAAGIDIVLSDTGDADPPAEPFNPAALDLPLDVVLEALELRDIDLSMDGGPPQRVEAVDLAGRLQDQQLTVQEIRLRAADGSLSGNANMGLVAAMPLRLDMQWEWRLAGQLVGGHVQAAGDANIVEIDHAGRGVVPVNLRGKVLALLSNPGWDLALDWPDFAIPIDQSTLSVSSGSIHSEGDLDQYHLASEGKLTYEGMDPVAWSLSGTGTTEDLQLRPLHLVSGPYQLALSGTVGWSEPLDAQLDYRATLESLALLNPDLPERLDAVGVLAARLENDTLVLEQFDLALEQAELRLSLAGSAVLPQGADPLIDANLQWQDLQWPIAGPLAQALINSSQGTATVAGTFDAWNLNLGMHLAGEQLPPGQWTGRATGNRRELQLESLKGAVLDGAIALRGVVGWEPVPAWQLKVSGQSLDPGSWQPAFPGLLAFDFTSQGDVRDETGPQATFELGQLSGELAGVPLAAHGNGSILGELVQLDTIRVNSGDNAVSASGQVDAQRLGLDWTMRAPDPGLLLHGAGGSLEGRGRVEGSLEQPVLRATLVGSDLLYEEFFLSRLGLSLQGGAAAQAPLQLDFELGPLQQGGETLLDSVRLSAVGTTANQQLAMDLQAEPLQLKAQLTGGLDTAQSDWRGQLDALTINGTGMGRWALARPAELKVGAAGADLQQSCLQQEAAAGAAKPARACAASSWSTDSGSRISLDLRSFALARWLPEVSGELNGKLAGALAPDGALTASGQLEVSPGELGAASGPANQPLRHGGGRLDIRVGPEGLVTALDFEPLQDGHLRADLALPQLNRLPATDVQLLSGRIRAQLPDLGGLQGWVPQLEAVIGRLDSDFKLAGDLRQPEVTGELALTGGAAEVPAAGLRLQDIQLRLHDDPARPGQLLLTGGLRSGEGALVLDGRMQRLDNSLSVSVTGESVKVFDTPDAKVKVSPDLDLVWSDELLTLRGQLVVPEAKITPRLALGGGSSSATTAEAANGSAPGLEQVIAPSADVIVLGLQEEVATPAEALPFRMDAEVALILGEKVSINALGLAGNLAGKVTFRNQGQLDAGPPIADGSLSIENGSFRAFGQNLEIETGRVIYRNTPVTEPEVNLRAVRWIDNDPLVSAAGVQVNGPLTDPVLELFSRPQLDPTEIQSYLLTGHSSSGGDSVLSIGAYLYPKLYVGYGYNLLEETSEFNSLYTITPRYGLETSVGEADNAIGVTITYEH